MDHLWAPWRGQYVTSGPENRSEIFADIARSADDDQHFVLWRGKASFALLNLFPYNTGHLMVVPYRVTGQLEDLADGELLEIMHAIRNLKAALTAAFRPQGFNVGLNLGSAAGAGIVQHLHFHLVPRWEHDSNFMTVTADTRVHPNDLKTVYSQIKAALAPQ